MRHRQILDKLAARGLVQALDEELARWVREQMAYSVSSYAELERAVIPPILVRWRCLLDADDASPATKHVAWVALATLLHKYGFRDDAITSMALTAVDELNRHVVLSDAFERQSPAIKSLLRSKPTPLARRPRLPRNVTFLRPGDVLSIELSGRFHAAYVRDLRGINEFPVIEFYTGTFAQPPTPAQLESRDAARDHGRARFGVVGMSCLPDPAGQVRAIAAQHRQAPRGADPLPGRGLWQLTDILNLQRDLRRLFGDADGESRGHVE
ncbi:hypothetical protein [Streptomyces celluloflavus]|uniref:hypothetical protein n=1 Tax=Streptomyces celluloflavus TaxID=58344 RepID=UPI0036A1AF90